MRKHLEYYVFLENNGTIKEYNIFNNLKLRRGLVHIYDEYKKEYMNYLKSVEVVKGEEYIDDNLITIFKENYKARIFKQAIISELKYCFWAKCEYEIVLTDWPTVITKQEVERLSNELDKGSINYRTGVNLDTERKVDVWDQISINVDIFIDYVWSNIDLVKEFEDE